MDSILIALTQMVFSWDFLPSMPTGKGFLRGMGFFGLESLCSALALPQSNTLLSLMYLNEQGIITSAPHRADRDRFPFILTRWR